MSGLDARLLAAHAVGDHEALVTLYTEAADQSTQSDATGFYLTHAYIYGLETGHASVPELRARLVEMGRESPPVQAPES